MKTIYSELERLCIAVEHRFCAVEKTIISYQSMHILFSIVRNKSCSVVKAIYSRIECICAEVRKKILNVLKTVTQC